MTSADLPVGEMGTSPILPMRPEEVDFTDIHQPISAGLSLPQSIFPAIMIAGASALVQLIASHHLGVVGVTPDASENLRAFGGHSLLNSGTGQHARAMFHDAG
jgi:hypothetical protein